MSSYYERQTERDEFFLDAVACGRLEVYDNNTIYNTETRRFIGRNANPETYTDISLRCKQTRKLYTISKHRLVWIAFGNAIPEDRIINHKDGNKSNAMLKNLELTTHQGNSLHAYATGLSVAIKGQNHYQAYFSDKDVVAYRMSINGETDRYVRNKKIALVKAKHGISTKSILDMLKGVTYKHLSNLNYTPYRMSESDKEKILKLRADRISVPKIAKLLGYGETTITDLLRTKERILFTKSEMHYTATVSNQNVEFYRNKLNRMTKKTRRLKIGEAATKLKVRRQVVIDFLAGSTYKNVGGLIWTEKQTITEKEIRYFREMYDRGTSINQLAIITGRTRRAITGYLER